MRKMFIIYDDRLCTCMLLKLWKCKKKKKLTKLFVYVAPVLHYRQRFFNGFINYANLQQQESSSSSLSSKECHTLKQKAQENFPNFLTINLHIKIFGNYLSDLRGA